MRRVAWAVPIAIILCGQFRPLMTRLFYKDTNEISSLTVERARALSQHEGELYLNGLTTLSPVAESALAQHNAKLALNGLTTLTSRHLAEKLASQDRCFPHHLTAISDEAAKGLSRQFGDLHLNCITQLSDEAAKSLAQHRGTLFLNGLTTLSDEAARALAQHKSDLSLGGLPTLSPDAAKAQRANPDIRLPDKFKGQPAPMRPLLLAIALPARLAAAEPAAWRVVSVHDGDTLTALDATNVQHKVRLTAIDVPERSASGSRASRWVGAHPCGAYDFRWV